MSQVSANAGTGGGLEDREGQPESGEVTDQLALAAARTQRRNQPRAWLVIGVVAVMATFVYAAMGLRARAAASETLSAVQSDDAKIRTALAKLKALQDAGGASGQGARTDHSSSEHALSTIIALAREAGLENPLGATTPNTSEPGRAQGWSQTTYLYTVKDPSIDAILRWMELVQQRLPAMGINKLTVRPEPTVWSVTVEFARWTKPEQTKPAGSTAPGGGRTP
jgi:hypothetical protein